MGWDKAVLARFGTMDDKALDKLRLQLGEPVFPQLGQGIDRGKHSDAAPGARRMAF